MDNLAPSYPQVPGTDNLKMNQELREILLDIRAYLKDQKSLGNAYLPSEEIKVMKIEEMQAPENKVSTTQNKGGQLQALKEEIGECTRCRLAKERNNIVFGVGNPDADLMFVGEGPGSEEDRQGIPFVGRAGQLLTKIIEAINLKRDDVYIANVVKCRPPENRNPAPDEINMCEPFLLKQIDIIKPKIIVCLGAFAAQLLLNTEERISKLRGKIFDFHNTKLIPTYHPAFLLRNSNMKRPVWEDMKKVAEILTLEKP